MGSSLGRAYGATGSELVGNAKPETAVDSEVSLMHLATDSVALTARNVFVRMGPRVRKLTLGYKYFTATRFG
jgi:hypothetical protein